MRILLLFIMLFCACYFSYSQGLKGKVFDSETKKPLVYVNIGLPGKNTGTVSNEAGYFEINIKKENIKDTLMFSHIGYKPFRISVGLLKNNSDSIFLEPRQIDFKPLEVTASKKMKTEKLGISNKFPGVYGYAENKNKNDIIEWGQKISLGNSERKIRSFHIYLKDVKVDTALFRINFYEFKGENPGANLLEKEIFVKQKIINGWLEINLEPSNIWLKGDVLAAIEFLPVNQATEEVSSVKNNKENFSFFYGGLLGTKGTTYQRQSSLGAWEKIEFGTISLFIKARN